MKSTKARILIALSFLLLVGILCWYWFMPQKETKISSGTLVENTDVLEELQEEL